MSKKDKDELVGFRDFMHDKREAGLKRHSAKGQSQRKEGFELLTFLELESKRLDKHIELMQERLFVIRECDTFERLNRDINQEITKVNMELMEKSFQKGSALFKSLRESFTPFFE